MTGILCWIAFGAVAGFVMSRMMPGYDVGLIWLTIGVGVAGAVGGGFTAVALGTGSHATLTLLGTVAAFGGAAIALLGYRLLIRV